MLIYKVWFHWRIPIGKFLYSLFCDGINILVKNNKCTQNQRTGDDLNMWSHPRQWEIAGFCPAAAAAAKSLQSSPTLCDPIDSGPPGFPVPGILQARTLEWAAISFSNAWKWKVKVKSLSRVRLLATPWTAAYQAPPSMEFSRQEYWSGVPLLVLEMSGALWGRESRPSFGLWHRTVEALITKRDWEEWMLGTRPQA